MKTITLLSTLTVVTAIAVAVGAADKEKKKPTDNKAEPAAGQKSEEDVWMHSKLESAQQIFSGLMHGDLDAVKKRAQVMRAINVLENWLTKSEFTRKSAYQAQLNAFEFANKELIRQAEDENLEGAFDSWVKLSHSCVECHKLIRDPAR